MWVKVPGAAGASASASWKKAIEVGCLGSERDEAGVWNAASTSFRTRQDQERLTISTKFIGTRAAIGAQSGAPHYCRLEGRPRTRSTGTHQSDARQTVFPRRPGVLGNEEG